MKRKTTITAHEPARYAREPEFVDSYGLKAGYGISRSLAYVLTQAGLIQSVSIRRPGRRSRQETLASFFDQALPQRSRAQAAGQETGAHGDRGRFANRVPGMTKSECRFQGCLLLAKGDSQAKVP
jgi:hypothetical protein